MSTKLDRAPAAGYFALAHALPESDRPDTSSAASSGTATTAGRGGLPDGGKNRIGLAYVVTAVMLAWFAAVMVTRLGVVMLTRLAGVPSVRLAGVRFARLAGAPRLTRRSGAPRRCFGWPAS